MNHLAIPMLPQLLEPRFHVRVRLMFGNVIDQQSSYSTTIKSKNTRKIKRGHSFKETGKDWSQNYALVMALKRSCPAVSHTWALIFLFFTSTVLFQRKNESYIKKELINFGGLKFDLPGWELDSNGRCWFEVELVLGESCQKIGLANSWITNKHNCIDIYVKN